MNLFDEALHALSWYACSLFAHPSRLLVHCSNFESIHFCSVINRLFAGLNLICIADSPLGSFASAHLFQPVWLDKVCTFSWEVSESQMKLQVASSSPVGGAMKTFRMAAMVAPFASMGIGGTGFLVTKAVGSFLQASLLFIILQIQSSDCHPGVMVSCSIVNWCCVSLTMQVSTRFHIVSPVAWVACSFDSLLLE